MCSRWCTGRRAVGREHSPEELQCWSYRYWMRIFPASLAAACLSGSCWSTDRRKWARRAELIWTRTHSNRLPVVDSAQCWGMVSCSWLSLSDLSTLMLSHWKIIGSLAYQNNSSLPLWSPFPVCIWPVYTRFYPPSCKRLLWPDGAVWVLQWTMVCHCFRLVLVWMHISSQKLIYNVTVSVSSSR